MGIFSWVVILLFLGLALNAGFIIRYRIFARKWPSNRVLIWANIILIIVSILFVILPKSDGNCKVKIKVNNRNSTSEIIINRQYNYNLTDDEIIILDNLRPYGSIAIKTKDEAIIIHYFDNNHLFKVNHNIDVLILNNRIIEIKSFPKLSFGKITNDIQLYDKIIELYK